MTNGDFLMNTHMTQGQMPDDLREIYFAVRAEVAELNARWIVFKQLFATGQSRIGLFNSAAPAFFSMVHDSMRDGIFLSIVRLTDKARVAGKDKLSLSQLLAQTQKVVESNATEPLKVLLGSIEKELDAMKTWRNKSGAHNDLRTVVQPQVHPLPKIMFDSVGIVLRLLSDFLNNIGQHFGYSHTDFANVIMMGDGDAIVRCLERDHLHRNCRIAGLAQY